MSRKSLAMITFFFPGGVETCGAGPTWSPEPNAVSLLGLPWPWHWVAGQSQSDVGMYHKHLLSLAGLLAPPDNFLILIY